LPVLLAAWRVLGQPAFPGGDAAGLDEFWQWAAAHWDVTRIPQGLTVPAARADEIERD